MVLNTVIDFYYLAYAIFLLFKLLITSLFFSARNRASIAYSVAI